MRKPIQSNNTETKNWNYEQNGCKLSFSLRVDIKEEMKTYIDLLRASANNVEEELKKRFPNEDKKITSEIKN